MRGSNKKIHFVKLILSGQFNLAVRFDTGKFYLRRIVSVACD